MRCFPKLANAVVKFKCLRGKTADVRVKVLRLFFQSALKKPMYGKKCKRSSDKKPYFTPHKVLKQRSQHSSNILPQMPDEISTSRMKNTETKFQENCIRSEMSKLINNACQSVYANKRVPNYPNNYHFLQCERHSRV